MIKFIIIKSNSKRDRNGNVYTYSTITSTKTGKSIKVWEDASLKVKELLSLSWDEIYTVERSYIPKRQFNFFYDRLEISAFDLTAEMLEELERNTN